MWRMLAATSDMTARVVPSHCCSGSSRSSPVGDGRASVGGAAGQSVVRRFYGNGFDASTIVIKVDETLQGGDCGGPRLRHVRVDAQFAVVGTHGEDVEL